MRIRKKTTNGNGRNWRGEKPANYVLYVVQSTLDYVSIMFQLLLTFSVLIFLCSAQIENSYELCNNNINDQTKLDAWNEVITFLSDCLKFINKAKQFVSAIKRSSIFWLDSCCCFFLCLPHTVHFYWHRHHFVFRFSRF